MSLFVASLNSGSNGNCYYVGNNRDAILVDAGLSCRETEKRLKRLGLSISNVRAIFISHEHTDHVKGLSSLVKKHLIPTYITPGTYTSGRLFLEEKLVYPFRAYQPLKVGSLTISAFPKYHDASDPHSFVIDYDNVKIGVFTDIGAPCEHLINHFKQCHAAFLEANYDEDLLEKGSYPYYLKRRIKGGKGHLSNSQALSLFKTYRPTFMSHLFLSHLSKDNNCPNLVRELFNLHAGKTEIIVASRYEETGVYQISLTDNKKVNLPVQYSLF